MWSGGALTMVCVAGGLTMVAGETVLGTLPRNMFWTSEFGAGTLHPCPNDHAAGPSSESWHLTR